MEEARIRIGAFIGAHPESVYFCSGGTEANNFIIKGIASANKGLGNHVITTCVEHHSVTDACRFLEDNGFRVTYLPVDDHGLVDPDDVKRAITDGTILISVMHANNEVGTIQPIKEIGEIAGEKRIAFHTDAVQTVGHIPVNVNDLCVDALSASAHKLYGPKGVGIAYIKRGIRIAPSLHGGGQESHFRPGTQNLPGIVGFGKAVDMAAREMGAESDRLINLKNRLVDGLFGCIDDIKLNGHPEKRLFNNVNVTVQGVGSEKLLLALRLEGISASNGSACNSLSGNPSHVLLSMGLSPQSCKSSLRFTLGNETTDEDIDRVIEVLRAAVRRFRTLQPEPANSFWPE